METAKNILCSILKSLDFGENETDYYIKNKSIRPKLPDYFKYIKLLKSNTLEELKRFPDWESNDGISLYDYQIFTDRYAELEKKIANIIELQQEINKLNNESLIEYKKETITINGVGLKSLFSKKHQNITLARKYSSTIIKSNNELVNVDNISIKKRWKSQQIELAYFCKSSELYEEQIENYSNNLRIEVKQNIDIFRELDWLVKEKYDLPVLFVSHRWSSKIYPDDSGNTLKNLLALDNCYFIYDFSSFPQNKDNSELQSALHDILNDMNNLIREIVIIKSDDYLSRGWCLYEYTIASIHKSIICDTVRASDFENLRNWRSTEPMIDSDRHMEVFGWKNTITDRSLRQNYINEKVLESINSIIPRFKNAKFSIHSDKEIVLDNLFKELLEILPMKAEYIPYLSDWTYSSWTEEELRGAFDEPLDTYLGEPTMPIEPNILKVASSIEEAMDENYLLRRGNQKHTFLS
jgi:hypothetical protein